MEQYINKATLEAEIRKRFDEYSSNILKHYDACKEAKAQELGKILTILDTLEVKEIDSKNSIVCKVNWYDGFFLDYSQEQQDALLERIGVDVGDKVRVILMKE